MVKRFTVRRGSSWVQTLGYWPLNIMQNRLAHTKIAGGMQRFRSGLETTAADVEPPMPAPVQAPAPSAKPARQRSLPIAE